MKRLFILMFLNVSFINIWAQTVAWAKKGGLWAYDYGYGIANDRSGNLYVAGKYEKNANFSGVVLPCQGNHDMFVAQYSPSGNLNWIRTAGGPSGDYAHALACDGNFVYVAGEIEGSNTQVVFPGSSATLTTKGNNDVMLAKYSLSGSLIWARSTGAYNSEKALGITSDQQGNIFICGYFKYSTKFGSVTMSGAGDNDVFIAKYDPNGNFLWVQKAAGPGRDEAKAIQCDAYGNVYICGLYSNECKFGSQTLYSINNSYEMFVAKYSSSGSLLWVKKGGGKYSDIAWGLALDKYNNMYVAGEFNSSANFSGITINTTGSQDVFVAKYDLNGNIKWIKKAGGSSSDRARAIACAGSNVYITGQFGHTAYFGPHTKYAADGSDIFTAGLDNNGNFKWVSTAGGPADAYEELGYESGNAICAETSGNVYSTGSMLNGATFGNTHLSAYTRTDVFVVKILSPATRENEELFASNEEEAENAQEATRTEMRDDIRELKVYPNPGEGIFIMEITSKENVEYDLTVFNSLGQVIEQKKVTAPVVTNMDMSDKERGIYIFEVSNATERHQKKIILR